MLLVCFDSLVVIVYLRLSHVHILDFVIKIDDCNITQGVWPSLHIWALYV